MPWNYTMPDGRLISVSVFGKLYRWALLEGFGYGEITGVSKKEEYARVRALLTWRDSTGAKGVPLEALEAANREAA